MPSLLPAALAGMDDSELRRYSPEDLIENPGLLKTSKLAAATAALLYSRDSESTAYDELAYRFCAATPVRGEVPLQTLRNVRRQKHSEVDSPSDEHVRLRHRPIDLPHDFQHMTFQVDRRWMHLRDAGRQNAEIWTYPLSTPPVSMLNQAGERDEPLIPAQNHRFDLPGLLWIPLPQLISSGRFVRMQEWQDHLCAETLPGRMYCFLSHRWLTLSNPDPEGSQAAYAAWQLFSTIAEAARVAHLRGLFSPRKYSQFPIGVQGSALAEAVLVNVLRKCWNQEQVDAAWREVEPHYNPLDRYGARAALNDTGLGTLRALITEVPLIAPILDRVFVWYDYSCIPQAPRSAQEEIVFRGLMEKLVALQFPGRTVVLLDDAEDYLSRGWCNLESLVADTETGSIDLLVGSARRVIGDGRVEIYFELLMTDRPHILWRAVLDTEAFGIETPAACLQRLEVKVTDPRDVPIIYRALTQVSAPRKVHVNDSELVTGVLPLPVVESRAVVPRHAHRLGDPPPVKTTLSLDWSAAFRISSFSRTAYDLAVQPFAVKKSDGARTVKAHAAIIASCEGEAVLFADWLWTHASELETAIEANLNSVSWIALDIAPVGHLVYGQVGARQVEADVWVLVAASPRFLQCPVTQVLGLTLTEAGIRYIQFDLDRPANNLKIREQYRSKASGEKDPRFERLTVADLRTHAGGLFRGELLARIV